MLQGFRGTRLDQIWNTNQRNPGFRVCIWNPKFDNLQSVATFKWKGPRYDISQFVDGASVTQNQVFENSSDAVSSRAAFSLAIDEDSGILVGSTRLKVNQKMFKDGTPIAVYEGDTRIAKADWPVIFTGLIRGNPGANTSGRSFPKKLRIQAYGRAQIFQRQQIVGRNWSYDSDLGDMAVDTAMAELGLTREEILFGTFDKKVKHKANALAQIGKMEGLYELMKPVQRKPYFDSRALLVSHDTSLTKPPVWFFREDQIVSITRVQNLGNETNSVEVIGLDSNLTKITQSPRQLNDVNISTGYFDSHYTSKIYYSEDKTRRAENTFIQVKNHPSFNASATWTEADEFHGVLRLDTGYAPEVLGLVTVVYVTAVIIVYYLDWLIDTVGIAAGFLGVLATSARFVLQMVAHAALVAALIIMQKIGRWEIEVHGEPFENVYQELRSIAVLKGTPAADTIERTERIHWLSTISECKEMARVLLRRELVKAHSYEITCPSVPILEVDDLVEVRATNHGFPRPVRFYIISIDRSFQASGLTGLMKLRGWFVKEEMP